MPVPDNVWSSSLCTFGCKLSELEDGCRERTHKTSEVPSASTNSYTDNCEDGQSLGGIPVLLEGCELAVKVRMNSASLPGKLGQSRMEQTDLRIEKPCLRM